MTLSQEVEHLFLNVQDNLRNPLQFIGGFLKQRKKKARGKDVVLSVNLVNDMIKAIDRAELALTKEK